MATLLPKYEPFPAYQIFLRAPPHSLSNFLISIVDLRINETLQTCAVGNRTYRSLVW